MHKNTLPSGLSGGAILLPKGNLGFISVPHAAVCELAADLDAWTRNAFGLGSSMTASVCAAGMGAASSGPLLVLALQMLAFRPDSNWAAFFPGPKPDLMKETLDRTQELDMPAVVFTDSSFLPEMPAILRKRTARTAVAAASSFFPERFRREMPRLNGGHPPILSFLLPVPCGKIIAVETPKTVLMRTSLFADDGPMPMEICSGKDFLIKAESGNIYICRQGKTRDKMICTGMKGSILPAPSPPKLSADKAACAGPVLLFNGCAERPPA
ncbi:MAG: hypothetical protein ABIG11_05610 [bacterium]